MSLLSQFSVFLIKGALAVWLSCRAAMADRPNTPIHYKLLIKQAKASQAIWSGPQQMMRSSQI